MRWMCSQIGAREHYAIPRVLHRAGKLNRLYTDFWAGAAWRALGTFTGKHNLTSRFHRDLTEAPITSFNLHALRATRQRYENPYERFLYVGGDFGRSVVESLKRKNGVNWKETVFFGYDTGFLEPARWVKARGGRTVVCQMDPSRFEVDLVKEEEKRWPGWVSSKGEVPESYFLRREEEWEVADLVMVNSEWSRQALIRQGVNEGKIVVVPLAYETSDWREEIGLPKAAPKGRAAWARPSSNLKSDAFNSSILQPFNEQRPLRVLFLGQVILRKGIQYLIEAAKLLQGEPVQFDIVGPIGISEEAIQTAPSNMAFHGAVSRYRTAEFYRNADVFVLPTLSDGFALTQLEAMAHGLPVIVTPNCGEVVTDGVDGLTVPASDAVALAGAFQLLMQDPERLQRMLLATEAKVSQFSLSVLGGNLRAVEERIQELFVMPAVGEEQEAHQTPQKLAILRDEGR